MLKVPQLDDLGFEELFGRARSLIPTLTKEWTDFNDHDPGITMLQTFAWLTDTLNYYINATGEVHMLKYLKLLGLYPKQNAASVSNIALDGAKKLYLPRGAKLYAGQKPFEVENTYCAEQNHVCAIFNQIDDAYYNITAFAGADGSYAQIFTRHTNIKSALHFGFEQSLKGENALYFEVDDRLKRNAFEQDFSLSTLKWSFYKDGIWQEITDVSDQTCGFLKSGFIRFNIDTFTTERQETGILPAHYIRCELIKNEYEALPKIGAVYANNIIAKQTQTLSQLLIITYDLQTEIPIDYYIYEDDSVTVLIDTENGFCQDESCTVENGAFLWQRKIVFKEGQCPKAGRKIAIIITRAQFLYHANIGITTGYADQRLNLPIASLYEVKLALMTQRGNAFYYEFYDRVENIAQCDCDAKVFWYDEKSSDIVLGNGINGVQPERGSIVMAVKVTTSLLDGGNVLKGEINSVEDESFGISAVNISDATGGMHKESVKELQAQIGEKLNCISRAVSVSDYEQIVLNTPGLMIDSVCVIPSSLFCEIYGAPDKNNLVYIAVKPHTDEKCPQLSAKYKQVIADNLDKYRLLTTKIKVISPQYVGISIYGRISLHENTKEQQEKVKAVLRDAVEKSSRFGGNVIYGRLFSMLEMTQGIAGVFELSLERMGIGGAKNEHGDIEIYPDSIAYIKEINIEFAG